MKPKRFIYCPPHFLSRALPKVGGGSERAGEEFLRRGISAAGEFQ